MFSKREEEEACSCTAVFYSKSFRRDRVIELSLLIPAPESRRFARIEISVAQYMVFWFFFFFL